MPLRQSSRLIYDAPSHINEAELIPHCTDQIPHREGYGLRNSPPHRRMPLSCLLRSFLLLSQLVHFHLFGDNLYADAVKDLNTEHRDLDDQAHVDHQGDPISPSTRQYGPR